MLLKFSDIVVNSMQLIIMVGIGSGLCGIRIKSLQVERPKHSKGDLRVITRMCPSTDQKSGKKIAYSNYIIHRTQTRLSIQIDDPKTLSDAAVASENTR